MENRHVHLNPLPWLDEKWIRVNLNSTLRTTEVPAALWNCLEAHGEFSVHPNASVVNRKGDTAFLHPDGRYYCSKPLDDTRICAPGLICFSCFALSNQIGSGGGGSSHPHTHHQTSTDQYPSAPPPSAVPPQQQQPQQFPPSSNTKRGQGPTLTSSTSSAATEQTSESFLESWIWSPTPPPEQKYKFLRTLLREQQEISKTAAGSCLSTLHLRQRLVIYERFYIALQRMRNRRRSVNKRRKESLANQQQQPQQKKTGTTITQKGATATSSRNSTLTKRENHSCSSVASSSSASPAAARDGTMGLARIGTSAALNFSFAFLRRAWRSGEDIELCSELLLEALVSIQELPEASLFDTSKISPIWLDLLERTLKFLRQVVLGDIMGARCLVPKEDCFTALNLLLELGAQKGDLSSALDGVHLLLLLWEKEKDTEDNRTSPQSFTAPVVSILRRYERLASSDVSLNEGILHAAVNESFAANPIESFLRFVSLPDHENALMDLRQAAVVLISHLDRLAAPYSNQANGYLVAGDGAGKGHWMGGGVVGDTQKPTQKLSVLGRFDNECFEDDEQSNVFVQLGWKYTITKIVRTATATLALCSNGYIVDVSRDTRRDIDQFSDQPIIDIDAHPEGKYFITLNVAHEVFIGCVTDEANSNSAAASAAAEDKWWPALPNIWQSKLEFPAEQQPPRVTKIFCGVNASLVICESGEIFYWTQKTWGFPDVVCPKFAGNLTSMDVTSVAFGVPGISGILAVSSNGAVRVVEDSDLGPWTNDYVPPVPMEGFAEPIDQCWTSSHVHMALSGTGKLYSWGRGQDGLLGHGNYHDQLTPKLVEALEGKTIVSVNLGPVHCLAKSVDGELFGWGRNDFQQICPPTVCPDVIITSPILALPSVRVAGMFSSETQSVLWWQSANEVLPVRVPFVVDLTKHTFHLLDQLLAIVLPSATYTEPRQLPNQETECIAVASLNLLRLQLYAVIRNQVPVETLGLEAGGSLLVSIKQKILNLAGCSNILKTIQEAAQATLQIGWSVLLPTASERAQTLTSLLPSGLDAHVSASAGHRFMTDLLVGSLMAEDGLETALSQAIQSSDPEEQQSEVGVEDSSMDYNIPLLHLIKQLLRNNTSTTQNRLGQVATGGYVKAELKGVRVDEEEAASPSLELLHRFQRLLISQLMASGGGKEKGENEGEANETSTAAAGAQALLQKYVTLVMQLATGTLAKAQEMLVTQSQSKELVLEILKHDVSDSILYELILGLILLHRERFDFLASFDWLKVVLPLMRSLDSLNRAMSEAEMHDWDDMAWPGILCRSAVQRGQTVTNGSQQQKKEVLQLRKCDLENHNLDNGQWIVINAAVYDVANYQPENQATVELLKTGIGKDLTNELTTNQQHKAALDHLLANRFVGQYQIGEQEEGEKQSARMTTLLTHVSSERALGFLMGLRAGLLQRGPELQAAEVECGEQFLKSVVLSGGLVQLQPTNPFDEEKGDARSGTVSTAGSTPTDPTSHHLPGSFDGQGRVQSASGLIRNTVAQRVDAFVVALSEARATDPLVLTWMALCDRFGKENNLMWHQEFPSEHPIQEMERLLTSVLIRHLGLGALILAVIDRDLGGYAASGLPKPVVEIIRVVYETKWGIVRTRQQLNRSYKEVCAPIIEKCRFLLCEVRPVISQEQLGLQHVCLLHKETAFKSVVRRIIKEVRVQRSQKIDCSKPEDILNSTIQNQRSGQMTKSLREMDFVTDESTARQESLENLSEQLMEAVGSQENLLAELKMEGNIMNDDFGEKPIVDLSEAKTPTNETSDHSVCVAAAMVVNGAAGAMLKGTQNGSNKPNLFLGMDGFVNDVIAKLTEKSIKDIEVGSALAGFGGRSGGSGGADGSERRSFERSGVRYGKSNSVVLQQLIDFVVQDSGDVDTLRRAMYCQVQRYKVRKSGMELFSELIEAHDPFLDSVRYNLLSGYLGCLWVISTRSAESIMEDLNVVTAYQKADIVLEYSRILEWTLEELKRIVNENLLIGQAKLKCQGEKDHVNMGTYVFLKKLPQARFLLSCFAMLGRDFGPNELSLMMNSGIVGSILALLKQTGGLEQAMKQVNTELTVVCEDTLLKVRERGKVEEEEENRS